jgi:hypothetical protein
VLLHGKPRVETAVVTHLPNDETRKESNHANVHQQPHPGRQ